MKHPKLATGAKLFISQSSKIDFLQPELDLVCAKPTTRPSKWMATNRSMFIGFHNLAKPLPNLFVTGAHDGAAGGTDKIHVPMKSSKIGCALPCLAFIGQELSDGEISCLSE